MTPTSQGISPDQNPIISEARNQMLRGLIKYAAGYKIFCAACRTVLDCRSTVNVEIRRGETLIINTTVCARCFDLHFDEPLTRHRAQGNTVEVIDGRTLWEPSAPAEPRERKPRKPKLELIPGETYKVNHTSGVIRWKFSHTSKDTWTNRRRFVGTNLATGRVVTLKSTQKVKASA